MKVALAVVAAALLVACAAAAHPLRGDFDAWKVQHGREYASTSEDESRFRNYLANVAAVERDNAEQLHGASYSTTGPFMDMTEAEFLDTMLPHTYSAGELVANMPKMTVVSRDAAPASVDWVAAGAVTDIKNQGACGSCWAFSATGAMEGAWKLAGNALTSFSEQQLLDCDMKDGACNGGLPWNAFDYVKNAGGIETESVYPYKARRNSCAADSSKFVGKVSGWEHCPTDEVELAAALAQHGPLSVGINANGIMRYSHGVLRPTHSSCNPRGLNHGVVMVGYGNDNGVDFWVIRNSWGQDWGEKGYMRIERGTGACGLNTAVTRAVV